MRFSYLPHSGIAHTIIHSSFLYLSNTCYYFLIFLSSIIFLLSFQPRSLLPLLLLFVCGSLVGVPSEVEGQEVGEKEDQEVDGWKMAVEAMTRKEVMAVEVKSEAEEVVASFITSLFVSGPLAPCLPVLLAAQASRRMLETVRE